MQKRQQARRPAPKGGARRRPRGKNGPLSYGGRFCPEHLKRSCCQTTARPLRPGGKRGGLRTPRAARPAKSQGRPAQKAKRRAVYLPLIFGGPCGTQLPPPGPAVRPSVLRESDPQKRQKAGCFAQNAQHRAAKVARCEVSGVPPCGAGANGPIKKGGLGGVYISGLRELRGITEGDFPAGRKKKEGRPFRAGPLSV